MYDGMSDTNDANDDADDDDEGSEGVCLGRLAPKQGPPILQEVPNTVKSILRGWEGCLPLNIYGDALKLTPTGQIDKQKDK